MTTSRIPPFLSSGRVRSKIESESAPRSRVMIFVLMVVTEIVAWGLHVGRVL